MHKDKLINWLLFLAISLIWGSSFILMKKALLVFPAIQVGALRILIATVVVLPFALKNTSYLRKDNWHYFLVVGLIGSALPAFLFTLAQEHISSSLSGILNALQPICVIVIGWLFFKITLHRRANIGAFISLLGAIAIVALNGHTLANAHQSNIYGILVLAACVCYGISVNTIKTKLSAIPSVVIASVAFLLTFPVMLIVLLSTNFTSTVTSNELALQGLGYISILSVLGTALALVLYNVLIKRTSTVFASSVTYVIPIVALSWGLLDGETINTYQLLCIPIIFAGIYLINTPKD